ncbi:MAG: DNA-processing protein DprA, partial [Thermacetogeniaceae bacterium]
MGNLKRILHNVSRIVNEMENTAKGVAFMNECYFWASLQIGLDLSNRTLLYLYNHFGSGRAVFNAAPEEFQKLPLQPHVVERILGLRDSIDPEKTAEEIISKNIKITMLGEQGYPKLLAEISDPPVLLYIKGCLPPPEMPLIALVGARKATPYGKIMARKLAEELAVMGWGIVSGMARGVDSAAHEGTLSAKGYTLAVLGSGIDICYPRENQRLYERISEEGCLLSEFPPGTPPCSKNFPIRNRLISGCSLGTVVVEAGEKSGSLITASYALEQGRDVFAVPGNVT